MSNIERPIKTISLIILITIVVKMLGFLRILLMAKVFGTGIEANAFEAAYRIPDLLFTGIGVALSTTFIPIFTEYLTKGSKEQAVSFANNTANILLVLTAGVAIIGIIFAPYIVKAIYWGFSDGTYRLTVDLVRIMFPIIIFIALSFTYVGVLQSSGEFNIPAAISLPSNIINILYLLAMSTLFGVKGFAVAVLIGWSMQLIIQIPKLREKGYKYKWNLSFKDAGIRKMALMAVPVILGTSVQQVNSFVNSALASGLGNNAVAVLGYANYLYLLFAAVFTYALSAVVFPSLSKMHAVSNVDEFKATINKALRAIFFILTPIMAVLLVLNVPIIRVLLQRGKFDINSTFLTSTVLFYYSIGIIGFGVQEILNRAFYAIHNTKTPMKVGVIGMLINIVLNLILVRVMGIGGLALSASVASLFIAAVLLHRLSKNIHGLIETHTVLAALKALGASAVAGVCILFLYRSLGIGINANFMRAFASLAVSLGCGAIVYISTAWAFKMDEINLIYGIIKNKFAKESKEGEV